MSEARRSILGISFDGLTISGIVNEFVNLAAVLRTDGSRVLLDLGFDITLGRTPWSDRLFLPPWVETIRSIGAVHPPGYNADLVDEVFDRVVAGTSVRAAGVYDDVCGQLADLLVATFERACVRFLVVENGTLPDNPIFTEALYLAINTYGARQQLKKYVLWRDFDLPWSVEPHRYGPYPYPGVHQPEANEHICYAVVTQWMRKRMEAWAPGPSYHVIPDRFYTPVSVQPRSPSVRRIYGIPDDAYLIARCTRIVPQKSIERDLRLFDEIQRRLGKAGANRQVFLFVSGPVTEDPGEFERLRALEQTLSIAGQIVWADGLLPLHSYSAPGDDRLSIRDLLAEADLSSFLTTYDYEGFGNPPGEAMAMSVPYIATTYELYHEVYGSKGAVAPLLPIDRMSSPADPIPESFITWTMRVLTDSEYRQQIVERNLEVCRRYFSLEALQRQVREIFDRS